MADKHSNGITHSPVPVGQSPSGRKNASVTDRQYLTFPEAMQAVKEGKTISKEEWGDIEIVGKMRNNKLMFRSDEWHRWIVNDGDMNGTDWFIVEG